VNLSCQALRVLGWGAPLGEELAPPQARALAAAALQPSRDKLVLSRVPGMKRRF
jgi:hypothetical protein